jgi:hypothetical protein
MSSYLEGRKHVLITVHPLKFQVFYPLLRQGVQVDVRLGISIQDLLQHDLHISEDIIDQKIQCLFLDGHPVDDLRNTIVSEGSVLSLYAAMPGLVGACFRRQGVYAGLRQSISIGDNQFQKRRHKIGLIDLKLFNCMAALLGPILLGQGVLVQVRQLTDLLRQAFKREDSGIDSLQVNGTLHHFEQTNLLDRFPNQGKVFLQVTCV